jgi:hypothetical protein
MMEEFHARRIVECKRTASFVINHEMEHEQYKEKREEERV